MTPVTLTEEALPATSPELVVVLLAILFLLSFFFSGSETALFGLQKLDLRRIEEGRTATDRRLHRLLRHRPALITTLLMGNETVNVSIAALIAALTATLVPQAPWVAVLIATPALVLLSEITPKVIAFRASLGWSRLATWPIAVLSVVAFPALLVLIFVVRAMGRVFGVTQLAQPPQLGEDEFLVLVEQGAEQGVVHAEEREFIEAVFELDDLPVSRVMTPYPDIVALPLDISWESLLESCRASQFSRIPIYGERLDDILGVLLVKDLLRHRRRPLREPEELQRLLVEPVFVPETKPASEMMREMITRRIHMAFVVDEHGTLTGLVSLDDLIVELVGELGEEEDEDDPPVDPSDDALHVRGNVDIDDFIEETGIELPNGDYHTLAGYVLSQLGRIPEVGDGFEDAGRRFEVVEMDGRRIVRLKVAQGPAEEEVAS